MMTNRAWIETAPLPDLLAAAVEKRDAAYGRLVSYSRKVFIPLTKLCRDVCHYCTFAETPRAGHPVYLSADEVLAIAKAGEAAGCTEALFTLGDKPELRYRAAREALAELGHETTISYLRAMCALVLKETTLLPHVNPGVMTREDIASLRAVSASQGLMLESTSETICQPGGVHFGSPDKLPAPRLETIRLAGELKVPFTTGILIGIGETRAERLDALEAIAALHAEHGHIQEVIVQNFRAKPDTKRADADEPDLDDLLWTIAAARLILPAEVHVQAPPNLSPGTYHNLIGAGIDDWGGVSPVTIDHVNPEAPWPELDALARHTAEKDKILIARLPVYPAWLNDTWIDTKVMPRVIQQSCAEGWARDDAWSPGETVTPKPRDVLLSTVDPAIETILSRATSGERLTEAEIVRLFAARDADYERVITTANALREQVSGEVVRYVVNRNINYTNICYYRCKFCAFSKGSTHDHLRGTPYDLDLGEIVRRSEEAWTRGATEVCLQGGIHPDYTGMTYVKICEAIKAAVPDMHIHAFSPLEVTQGAATLGLSLTDFLRMLKEAGLGTLPGTAAEILDDEIRAIIAPDKINTQQWVDVIRAAHSLGLRTTSTIMYGHVEAPINWARHLLVLRDLQAETGGITEFVPLPFVHMEAPMYLRGLARKGPTLREAILMHSVARLVLHPLIQNIQVSWVKMGPEGCALTLQAGANDMGGTLMNESISRAAGTLHGQEFAPEQMESLISGIGRVPAMRDTTYGPIGNERRARSFGAPELAPMIQTPPKRRTAPERRRNLETSAD
jgi:FO synthase